MGASYSPGEIFPWVARKALVGKACPLEVEQKVQVMAPQPIWELSLHMDGMDLTVDTFLRRQGLQREETMRVQCGKRTDMHHQAHFRRGALYPQPQASV